MLSAEYKTAAAAAAAATTTTTTTTTKSPLQKRLHYNDKKNYRVNYATN